MRLICSLKISLVFLISLFAVGCGQKLSEGTSSDGSFISGVLPGSGSPDNPYLISSVEDWNYVGENPDLWSSDFQLQNDIDFTGHEMKIWGAYKENPENPEDVLIDQPFLGSLDGNGFALRNIYLDHRLGRDPDVKLGVFSYLSGNVSDLSILEAEVYSEGNETGILAGRVRGENVLIENVVISGDVHSRRFVVGGMIGRMISGTVKSSSSSADVTVEGAAAGGLIGSARGGPETDVKVIDSEATGSIRRANDSGQESLGQLKFGAFGGLVGNASKIHVENSHAKGSVDIHNIEFAAAGGLIGHVFVLPENGFTASDASIEDSSASGDVIADATVPTDLSRPVHLGGGDEDYRDDFGDLDPPSYNGKRVGGLIGEVRGARILRSFSSGAVEGSEQVGGLLGLRFTHVKVAPWPTFIIQSYSESSVKGVSQVGGLIGQAAENDFIVDSYALGSVQGERQVGGLAGSFQGNIQSSYAMGIVSPLEEDQDFTAESEAGFLVGSGSPTVTNGAFSFTQGNNTATDSPYNLVENAATLEAEEFRDASHFHGDGFSIPDPAGDNSNLVDGSVWFMEENGSHPILRWQLVEDSSATQSVVNLSQLSE
jgi:hypothetical protein